MRTEAEVLVVGAGPAGAVLGLELARCGRDVLIVERSQFPRDKACGDCANPGAVAELRRLGLADRLQSALTPTPLRGWRVEAPDGRAFRVEFGSGPDGRSIEGWAVRRRDLDAAVLEQACCAGARVRFGLGIYQLLRDRGRVSGVLAREGAATREIRASFTVGADGLRSVVQRRLGLARRPPRLRKIALVGHLAGLDGAEGFGELRVRGGRTCGFAPVPGGANVTLVIPERDAGGIGARAREFLDAALFDFPEVRERVHRFGLESAVMVTGPFDRPVSRPWAPGVILVGDAAGYFDPFTGQGIYQALKSGRLAAEFIDTALRDPDGELAALRRYGRRMRNVFAPKQALQRLIEATISRPPVMSRLVAALAEREGAARRLLHATSDVRHPGALLDPEFWSRLVLSMAYGKR